MLSVFLRSLMILEKIRMVDFRSFQEITVDSFGQINCLIGENGMGKTNFLEGIYLLSSNRGFRTNDRLKLARYSTERFYIGGTFNNEKIERIISEKKKKLLCNGTSITANELRTYNPIVTFSPHDIFLSSGSSEIRRKFFDSAIALLDSSYNIHLLHYERALRQRNSSLKKDPQNSDIWNPLLITHGAKLIEKRINFARKLSEKVKNLYEEFTKGEAKLTYFNNFSVSGSWETSLEKALESSKFQDLKLKHTSKGPHRDEISILIDKLPAAESGSQGQNRALAFALKIGAVQIAEEALKRKPILLLDDVLLEIDQKKRKSIFNALYRSDLQLFLTGTDKDFFHFIEHETQFYSFHKDRIRMLSNKGIE